MMNVGRLQGFEGKITAQGKLLQQDTFLVNEQDSSFLPRPKERRSLPVRAAGDLQRAPSTGRRASRCRGYTFKNSIKVSCLGVEDCADGDPSRFALDVAGGRRELHPLRHAGGRARDPAGLGDRRGPDTGDPAQLPQRPAVADRSTSGRRASPTAWARLPCLHSYNSSLPSLYLPSQALADARPQHEFTPVQHNPSLSNPSPQPLSPAHVHLCSPEQCGSAPAPPSRLGISNGLCSPAQHSVQRSSNGCRGASAAETAGTAPGSSGAARSSNLTQLAEDDP
ncbi:hypothetical protein SKAU_G00152390 [Synaphobranchus kaupii]|uniref:Uncharacterized protein n=1 Tax=Synaphobranchus kaupii TaxID=118154 RepID=A0A9Q1FGX0_SYNKA|nr:hypothetical protein SKAU_G00152390 [Synaphobranchus kaupii]